MSKNQIIPYGWVETTLGENIAEIAMGPFGSNLKVDMFTDSGVPIIKGGNLLGAAVGGDFSFVSEEKANSLRKAVAFPGDIIITHRGTLGQVSIVPENKFPRYVTSQSQLRLSVNPNKLHNRYLLYFLRSRIGQYELFKNTSQVGVPAISTPTKSIKEIELIVPSDPKEQEAISNVLSAFDDKIELLQAQNKSLESIAQTIFTEWFGKYSVDDELPEGWKVGTLGNEFDITIGRTPPRLEYHWFSKLPIGKKWISIRDIGNAGAYIFNTSEFLTDEAVQEFNIPIIPKNTTILSFKMTVGKLTITTEEMLSNEAIAHLKVKDDSLLSSEYIYLYLQGLDFNALGSTSSIVTAINSAIIKGIEIIVPKNDLLQSFRALINPLFKKIKTNSRQIQVLTSTRDEILPKLLNGEIRLQEFKNL